MNFRRQLEAHLDELTPSQRTMAKYIFEHMEQVPFMTTRQLAAALGQSDATVVRFARAIGYAGFPELREAMRAGLLEKVGASGLRASGMPSDGTDLKHAVFETDMALVRDTGLLNADETVVAVADALIGAHRIWVTGHGSSYPLAAYLAMHLNQCLGNAHLLTLDHGDLADRLREVGPDDVVVGIGYVRYLPYTIDVLRIAKSLGAQVVAITDRVSSPLARLARHSLYVARGMSSPIWWSQSGTLALANWLAALVMSRAPDLAQQQLRRSDEMWKLLGHWSSSGNDDDDPSLEQRLEANMSTRAHKGRGNSR